ncbi:MAG: hypothetical protein U0234_26545 [Sandaracinus sp.]
MSARHSVFLASLTSLACLGSLGCTVRGEPEPDIDAFVPPAEDTGGRDAGTTRVDAARTPDAATVDTGGTMPSCAQHSLGSAVGDAVATGSTLSGTDHYQQQCSPSATGNDVLYAWTAPSAGTYVIDLNGSDYDTQLAVLSACQGTELACDDDGGTGTQSLVQVLFTAGQQVIIDVDGHNDDGNYVLNIHAVSAEICDNATDDDRDGAIDCLDTDCRSLAACDEASHCTDMIDNDGDGRIDCRDTDCATLTDCDESLHCGDTIDNDVDGRIDCADTDCAIEPMCNEAMHCDDMIDNDGDGATDCADSGCSAFPACNEGMNCADGIDNDRDGRIDCADTNCATFGDCIEAMHCTDHVDNDRDGATDCADTECMSMAAVCPPETDCTNGLDDDGDGAVDCSDSQCAMVCRESTAALCMNAMDDDGDGVSDCGDPSCACTTPCPPAVAPSATCPDATIDSMVGDGVFHGTIAAYACGARQDASCGNHGLGGEIEVSWTAPTTGVYVFDTEDTSHAGGTFDTLIALRTACSGGIEFGCDEDGGTGSLSRVSHTVAAGQVVVIVIEASHPWDGGNVTLNIHAR